MKFCIAAFLLIASVAPTIFAYVLSGPQNFTRASQDMIKSPTVPPRVKQIFQRYLAAIEASKPCEAKRDIQCILNAFKTVGIKGMNEGIASSSGPLKQLFQKLLQIDQQTVSDLSALPASAGEKAVQISNVALNNKGNEIREYLGH